jgi:uncharacterized protein (TIGR02117 family)
MLFAVPALYLVAALIGSLIPVNRGWTEPSNGIPIFLASNGLHVDIIMPVRATGLDWPEVVSPRDVLRPRGGPRWIAIGIGERAIYLDTPRWRDLRAKVAVRALTRGDRIIHVQWVEDPSYAGRAIRLRPEEYRRLWAAVRSSFRGAKATTIPGRHYGPTDAFYLGYGHASALDTCNQWVASRLRLAGVKTSLWSPFAQGLLWRYRARGRSG